ncbi:esterase-like activity of phytase family protein [Tenacibaculum sp. TC6]|uniref:esterase-like activity of phytase family protein n=1 Tax=Tenacibaculum sp. TC6 TaxID=3423223 RepID=UPI003D364D20
MKYRLLLLLLPFLSCKKESIQLTFLDEYVVKDSLEFQGNLIGGLSGIDRYKDTYYLVVDDSENPRVVTCTIAIENEKIKNIRFLNTISITDTVSTFYKEQLLDLESIFVNSDGTINLTSEGNIKGGKKPAVFITDATGAFLREIKVPDYFSNLEKGKPRHNGVFEGSCKGIENKGFWVAMEAPLEIDGDEPTLQETQSPVRITYFDHVTEQATKQYAYQLEKIDKQPKGNINLNGVTAILEYAPNVFFVVERIYQSDYGSYGNTIRIFKATANEQTTNTLTLGGLKNEPYIPLTKELVFDFSSVKDQLTEGIIDNIEGITFGPILPNGNSTLLVVSDDNFQKYGKQLNQFVLLAIEK